MNSLEKLTREALALLQQLIETPSFSGEESATANLIRQWLESHDIGCEQIGNNIIARNAWFSEDKPTLLLNSHHDTVRPNKGYTRDPFKATLEDGKLYGLGSNDAGGCLVSLLASFVYWHQAKDLSHNLLMVASAEEENSGPNSLRGILDSLPAIDVAIVGEPTEMNLAIAEKGLVVFDGTITGTPSHAAHPNPDNAIYNAIPVLDWFRNYRFPRVSETLGEVKLTVTQIKGGKQHNAVPAQVEIVLDVRVNDRYSNGEIAEILEKEAPCKLRARSLRLNSSSIDPEHPLVISGIGLGRKTYGSPTLSDQAALSCPSLKMGPGKSQRSHSADEFIMVQEVEEGIAIYVAMLKGFLQPERFG
ncbi:M20 family metallo-hydrolase [Robiginitalea aurantiaca]|uniref:M20 family metallo-hydrolase n=1 Tax=Robiginitalea aurantiaca TaxID=3056915 RepID=A0ABT7WEX9_9FLAO|nr:M20 family metallo-hydrolase [Robiginitalea aurantiaca]MDM9631433.1 M20 family metallo-hydrolase [Robiginitalea aurantiaca]